jgi:hypothetical protein
MFVAFVTLKLFLIHQFKTRKLLDGGGKGTDRPAKFKNQKTLRRQARRVGAQRKCIVPARQDFCKARKLRSNCSRLAISWKRRW